VLASQDKLCLIELVSYFHGRFSGIGITKQELQTGLMDSGFCIYHKTPGVIEQ